MFDRIRRVLIDPRVQRRKVIVFDAFRLAGLVEELGCVSSPPEERIAGVQAAMMLNLATNSAQLGLSFLNLTHSHPHISITRKPA